MSNETEKITVNLGVVELAQIDVLAEQGVYASRSDFIRTAIRKQLEHYEPTIVARAFALPAGEDTSLEAAGICRLSKSDLEQVAKHNGKINIRVLGMLIIDPKVSIALFEATVEHVTLRGKLRASKEIRKIIEEMNA